MEDGLKKELLAQMDARILMYIFHTMVMKKHILMLRIGIHWNWSTGHGVQDKHGLPMSDGFMF